MKLIQQVDVQEIYRCLFWEITENLIAKLSSAVNNLVHYTLLMQSIQGLNSD